MQQCSPIVHTLQSEVVPLLKNHVTRTNDLHSDVQVRCITYAICKRHIISCMIFIEGRNQIYIIIQENNATVNWCQISWI
jgi:hypothetical protein